MTTTSKKVLVPLATLLAAGAVAVGSGATFTSTTNNSISSVTAGDLVHTNSKDDAAIFTLDKIKPGDVKTGSLKIENTGDLDSTLSLTEVSSSNAFSADNLKLKVTDDKAEQLYSGTFGGLVDGEANPFGELPVGAVRTFTFEVSLSSDAPNDDQGKTATATYQWVSTQK
jgi:spore coat-associated protein N